MSAFFLTVLDMSFSASWLILALLLARPLLGRLPKWGAASLWGLVGLRLLVPFSIESSFSLIPGGKAGGYVPVMEPVELPAAEPFVPDASNVDILSVFSILWLMGLVFFAVNFALSYWRILKRLDTAVVFRENIYRSEWIAAPAVVGLLKPRIIVPFCAEERDLACIIAHEKAHIRRGDHLWKLLAYGVLALHWMNPLVWVAYVLLGKDIELACDEAVIGTLDADGRADYTQALVTCAAGKRTGAMPLLGFGAVGVRTRVKSILHYRKPNILSHILFCVFTLLLAVCFLTDPVMAVEEQPIQSDPVILREEPTEPTIKPIPDASQELELRAELEKLELQADLEKSKAQLAFYQECLDRDLKAYFQTEEKYQYGYELSIAFYRKMVAEIGNHVIYLENKLKEME